MSIAMHNTWMVSRYQGDRDSEFNLLAQEMIRVIHLKRQAQNRGHRRQGYVAFVPRK